MSPDSLVDDKMRHHMQVDHLLHLVCDFRFERNYFAQEVDRLKADGVQLRDQITSLTTVSDELRNDLVREKLQSSKALKELKEIQDLLGIIQSSNPTEEGHWLECWASN